MIRPTAAGLRARWLSALLISTVSILACACWLAPRASAFVYWTNFNTKSIGVATLDGSHSDPTFISTGGYPRGIAVDGNHVYWADATNNRIGRANLDGTGVNPSFIQGTGDASAQGLLEVGSVAVNSQHLYWADAYGVRESNLDGSGITTVINGYQECDANNVGGRAGFVALSASYLFLSLANGSGAGGSATCGSSSVGRANLDGSNLNDEFIAPVPNDETAIVADAAHIYWAHGASIARANGDGSAVNEQLVSNVGSHLIGLAVDGRYVYWATKNAVGRANLDGSGANDNFIAAGYAEGVAVDGRNGPLPGAVATPKSKGGGHAPRRCVVPNLRGLTVSQAKTRLSHAHCNLGRVVRKRASRARKGRVISSRPPAGTSRQAGSRVNLTVGKA